MAQDNFRIPSGSAGITRYFEEYKSRLSLRPEHVIALCILVGVAVIILHLVGNA